MIRLYRYLINPVFLFLVHIVAMFNKKVRSGIKNRRRVNEKLEAWLDTIRDNDKRILFHAASLGEFEHIKPLLSSIKKQYNTKNIVTFFSPSGYENAELNPGMDYKTYVPMESIGSWKKFYKKLKPEIIVIAKHDVWPGQIWAAQLLGIPIYLINASLAASSSRANFVTRKFLRAVYRPITQICAISEQDKKHFNDAFHLNNVEFLGDTKYDQVVFRKLAAQKQNLLPEKWFKNSKIIVAGSIWPEDAVHLFPALISLLKQTDNWKVIIVPHQPTDVFIDKIENHFKKFKPGKFSNRNEIEDERILVVDAIGYLAGLYHYAKIAYVGGSFRQGIHNTMEPAIFGIPVLYGPVHHNSYEAEQLANGNGGIVVNNTRELTSRIMDIVLDKESREVLGKKAFTYASANTGATEKLLKMWKNILTGKKDENSIS